MLPAIACPALLTLVLMTVMADQSNGFSPQGETTERLASWNKRWNNNKLGWHLDDVHKNLKNHGGNIIPNFNESGESPASKEGVRVFVPLCGKTVDMAFLAKHSSVSEVVGIDGVRQALVEFATENTSLNIKEKQDDIKDGYEHFVGDKITLLCGDFFDMDKASVEKFDAIWDRASIVAIQPELREDYVRIMGNLIKPGGTLLVSTLDRREGAPEGKVLGPPFSVDEEEIRRLYGSLDWVDSITKVDETDELSDMFRNQGMTKVCGVALVIKTKA